MSGVVDPREAHPFDPERFIEDCKRAHAEAGSSRQAAVGEVLRRVMSDTGAVLSGLGEPRKGGIVPLYRSNDLTILNVTWSPSVETITLTGFPCRRYASMSPEKPSASSSG